MKCSRCNLESHIIWTISKKAWKRFCRFTDWDPEKELCLECLAKLNDGLDLATAEVSFVIEQQIAANRKRLMRKVRVNQ